MGWSQRTTIRFAVGILIAAPVAAAGAQGTGLEVQFGPGVVLSSGKIPLFSAGALASAELVFPGPVGFRLSGSAMAPALFAEDKVCVLSPGGGCGISPGATQIATLTADVVLRLGASGRDRIFGSAGAYFANPSMKDPAGGNVTKPMSDGLVGFGYEHAFGTAAPKYALAIRFGRYHEIYQRTTWGTTIGFSRIFRFD